MKTRIAWIVVACAVLAGCADFVMPADGAGWNAFLNQPAVMAVGLLVGLLTYGLIETRDTDMTLVQFFSFRYVREAIILIVTAGITFIGGLVADQMTFLGAITLGLAGGVVSDVGAGGRAVDVSRSFINRTDQ